MELQENLGMHHMAGPQRTIVIQEGIRVGESTYWVIWIIELGIWVHMVDNDGVARTNKQYVIQQGP